jgi:mRNA deadenylase 3'-5' endonuclease subunit Ccr4
MLYTGLYLAAIAVFDISIAVIFIIWIMRSKSMTIFSLNVNSDRRIKPTSDSSSLLSSAFSNLSHTNRADLLNQMLIDVNADIVCLQEVDDLYLPIIIEFLNSLGYNIYTHKYTDNEPSAFSYVTAFRDNYVLLSQISVVFTEDGKFLSKEMRQTMTIDEKKLNNYDTEYEKSCPIFRLKINSHEIVLANVHLGLTNKHKTMASHRLCQFIDDLTDKSTTSEVIIVGDFNQFDTTKKEATVYDSQINIYKNFDYQWASKDIDCTFISFPYDIDRFLSETDMAECNAIKNANDLRNFYMTVIERDGINLASCALDSVFYRQEHKKTDSIPVDTVTNIGGNIIYNIDSTELPTMFLSAMSKPDNVIVSDHLGLLITLSNSN